VLQAQVEETARARRANIDRRKDVLVGTNMYANLGEERLSTVEQQMPDPAAGTGAAKTIAVEPTAATVDATVQAARGGASLAQLAAALRRAAEEGPTVLALTPLRVAASFEALRQAADAYTEAHGAAPRIFLANMGPLAQHKARADFTQGFVNVGGFVCDYPGGFETVEEAATAAQASGAQAVVVCSTDDRYPEIVPALATRIKTSQPDLPLLLAGYPKEHVDALRAAGVDEFIHLRADCYAVNAWLQQMTGVS
jgi:methylmalonyl-CoA mutase